MQGALFILSRFQDNKTPLAEHMRSMLLDEPKHHGERRGCGFSQSTRVLAQALHHKITRSGRDSALVEGPLPLVDVVRDWAGAATGLWADWLEMFAGIIGRDAKRGYPIATMPTEHKVGSCSMAEKHFLELAHNLMPRRGAMRVFCDRDTPVIVEKVNMGDAGSAINLAPICVEGVAVPAGALLAVEHELHGDDLENSASRVAFYSLADMRARVLRLTTLAADPEERAQIFGPQVSHQFHNNFVSPLETRLSHLTDVIDKWRRR